MSLPSRGRGLKSMHPNCRCSAYGQSLPSRGRGLKLHRDYSREKLYTVAPFTGAWIEICQAFEVAFGIFVAPFTGAWIEINRQSRKRREYVSSLPSRGRGLKCNDIQLTYGKNLSLPSRGRGLKCSVGAQMIAQGRVAPFTGAWIEIKSALGFGTAVAVSLPSRGRGLK